MYQVVNKARDRAEIFVFSPSEKLIRTQAQLLVQGGYLAAGYEYIIIDDCWLNQTRSAVSIETFLHDLTSQD